MIRMLAFDLDGTTITEHKYLSEENRKALAAAGRRGIVLVPATGRMRSFLPPEVESLPGVRYAVTSNGAAVYDLAADTPLFERLIPNGTARQVQAMLEEYSLFVEYYRDGKAATVKGYPQEAFSRFGLPESKRHFVESKEYSLYGSFRELLDTGLCPEKINLPYVPDPVRAELWARLEKLPELRLTSSIPDNIEINSSRADKGSALLELASRLGISGEEIMAVGDNGNDVAMLRTAGLSVAVGDGSSEALETAMFRTAPHTENGLAKAIRRFLLSEDGDQM